MGPGTPGYPDVPGHRHFWTRISRDARSLQPGQVAAHACRAAWWRTREFATKRFMVKFTSVKLQPGAPAVSLDCKGMGSKELAPACAPSRREHLLFRAPYLFCGGRASISNSASRMCMKGHAPWPFISQGPGSDFLLGDATMEQRYPCRQIELEFLFLPMSPQHRCPWLLISGMSDHHPGPTGTP